MKITAIIVWFFLFNLRQCSHTGTPQRPPPYVTPLVRPQNTGVSPAGTPQIVGNGPVRPMRTPTNLNPQHPMLVHRRPSYGTGTASMPPLALPRVITGPSVGNTPIGTPMSSFRDLNLADPLRNSRPNTQLDLPKKLIVNGEGVSGEYELVPGNSQNNIPGLVGVWTSQDQHRILQRSETPKFIIDAGDIQYNSFEDKSNPAEVTNWFSTVQGVRRLVQIVVRISEESSDLDGKLRACELEKSQMKLQVHELEKKLDESQSDAQRLTAECNAQRQKLATLAMGSLSLEVECGNLQERLDAILGSESENSDRSLKDKIGYCVDLVSKLVSEKMDLETKVNEARNLDEEMRQLIAKVTHLENENEEMKREKQRFEGSLQETGLAMNDEPVEQTDHAAVLSFLDSHRCAYKQNQ